MASTNKYSVQVFQDLYLRHPMGSKTIRSTLLQAAVGPWIHSDLKEANILDTAVGQQADVIAFERPATKELPGVTLWMFEDGKGGYKVSNVVPIQHGQLGVGGYNAALVDFASAVDGSSAAGTIKGRERLMSAMDLLNERFGRSTVHVAGEGSARDPKQWSMKQERRTPAYTTSWEDVAVVRA